MMILGYKGKLYRVSEFIATMAYLNILWIFFTFLGGVVLGIHPATIALFTNLKRWREKGIELVSYKQFKQDFKQEFKKANILGLFLNILIMLTVVNGILLYLTYSSISPILFILFVISVFLVVVLLLYVYATYVYFKAPVITTIVYSIVIGMAHPWTTFLIIVFTFLIAVVIYSTSGLPIFFGVSAISYVIIKYACKVFTKIDRKTSKFKQLTNL